MAKGYADEFSKDRSTKVAALLLDSDDCAELTRGYNGMPRGARDDLAERHERPLKLFYFEHAERNAIYNAVRPLLKGSVVVTTASLEMGCARAMISVGAARVYYPAQAACSVDERLAIALMQETGVECVPTRAGQVDPNGATGERADEARKVMQYLRQAGAHLAALAKDPHSTLTLFLSAGDFTVLTTGYSGMPRGVDDTRLERYEEPLRAYWVEGATRNAIYNAARRILKGSTAVVTATPCAECARALAAVGVSHIVHLEPSAEFRERWRLQLAEATHLLEEVGVTVDAVSPDSL